MNGPPLACIHRPKSESEAGRANSVCSMIRHRAYFRLASGAEAFNITHQTLPLFQVSTESLVYKMLQSIEQFSALSLQKIGVRTIEIENRSPRSLFEFDLQIKASLLKNRS